MPATALAAVPTFQVILFSEAFIAFRGKIIITLLQLHLFPEISHSTKVPNSYLVPMILLVNPYLLRKKYLGITIWPFIILRSKHLREDLQLINHERIHLSQQLELLVIPFFLWYGLEFLIRFIRAGNWQKAYRNIVFEREAYQNENDLGYLRSRSFWNFIRFY